MNMTLQLIKGESSKADALKLIIKLVHQKIRYHEAKIAQLIHKEDNKLQESKIIRLQKELFELRNEILFKNNSVWITAALQIN